tara:strand:+ start:7525 stop:8019 length:495 start_codon:yes stop_codon:yes gene_type:complete
MSMVSPTASSEQVVTSPYGMRDDGPHRGVDLRAAEGDPILSISDGTIVEVSDDPLASHGLAVHIDHDDGLHSRYMHGSEFPEGIKVGLRVASGSTIMYAGGSGNSNGPHLHFEVGVMNGDSFETSDPLKFLDGIFDDYKIKGTDHTVRSMLSDLDDDAVLRQSF